MSEEKTIQTTNSEMGTAAHSNDLLIPCGYDEHLALTSVILEENRPSAHMALYGVAGSGKGNMIAYLINKLPMLNGHEFRISCICGKQLEMAVYCGTIDRSNCLADTLATATCGSVMQFKGLLLYLTDVLKHKSDSTPDLIILDDVMHLLSIESWTLIDIFEAFVKACNEHNAHILIVGDNNENVEEFTKDIIDFDVVAATRVSKNDSIKLFGSIIASTEGGMPKYGSIVCKCNDKIEKRSIPNCSAI